MLVDRGSHSVVEIDRHPTADVALLTLANDVEGIEMFGPVYGGRALADEFVAFGFPENVIGPDSRQPTARTFVGHCQRFFDYESPSGDYRYDAVEMSVPAPAGLSGGPLFEGGDFVMAVVAENFHSTTLLEAVEDVTAGDHKHTIRHERIISYGIGVMLRPLAEWLDERVSLDNWRAQARARRERDL